MPCNLHFERKKDYVLGLWDQVASPDTEEKRKVNDTVQQMSGLILRLRLTKAEGFEVVGDKEEYHAYIGRIGGSGQHAGWCVARIFQLTHICLLC